MSDKDIKLKELNNLRKYRSLGMNCYPSLLVNKTIHQNNESLKHEITCYLIDCIVQRGGDVAIMLPILIPHVQEFSGKIEPIFKEWCLGKPRKAIAQAVLGDREHGTRKIDRVILERDEKIEIETNKKIKKQDCTTYYI